MAANPNAPDFELALGDLQDHLPLWWRTQDPTSQLYLVLAAIGAEIDKLNALYEQPYLDAVITTASEHGLISNFAFAWGLLEETLPTIPAQLIAYIQARMAETGTLESLVNTLTTLLGNQANQGGPLLILPATFPTNGAGLILYEWTTPPSVPVLSFPWDGSGLTFPASGAGLIFGTYVLVNVVANFATYQLTVQVLSYLAFDRGAFARAVERWQPGDWLPTIIQEVDHF